jgi:hypothetical protein
MTRISAARRIAKALVVSGQAFILMTFLDPSFSAEAPADTAASAASPGVKVPHDFVWVTAALDPLIGSARRIKLVRGPGDGVAIVEQPGRVGSDGINEVGAGPAFNPRHSPLVNAELIERKSPDARYRLFDLRRREQAGPRLRLSVRVDGVARLLVLDHSNRVSRVITLEPELPGE